MLEIPNQTVLVAILVGFLGILILLVLERLFKLIRRDRTTAGQKAQQEVVTIHTIRHVGEREINSHLLLRVETDLGALTLPPGAKHFLKPGDKIEAHYVGWDHPTRQNELDHVITANGTKIDVASYVGPIIAKLRKETLEKHEGWL